MKKSNFLVLNFLVFIGCYNTRINMRNVAVQNRERMFRLQLGMKRSDLLDTMGTQSIEVKGFGRMTNPYKIETIRDKDKNVFEVIYYLTYSREPYEEVTRQDLTPFIIQNGKVYGWGWDFFDQILAHSQE